MAAAAQHQDSPRITLVACKDHDAKTDSDQPRVSAGAVFIAVRQPPQPDPARVFFWLP